MRRAPRIFAASCVSAVLVGTTAAAFAQNTSILFTKTVGTDPNSCAMNTLLPEVPPGGVVYYCYQMTYSGVISASAHSLIDSELGSILNNIPGQRCCTDASANDCEEPVNKCSSDGNCFNGPYDTCAAVSFPGVCCGDEEGINCSIPHEGCIADSDCGGDFCVTHPIVADGDTVTRVITATVPASGIGNSATWTAEAGICCDDFGCDGDDNPTPCASDDDCSGEETCRMEGIGLCCEGGDPGLCDPEEVCLEGRTCEDGDDSCVVFDTSDDASASAQVGAFATPAASAAGMALLVLALSAFGLVRVRRQQL